MLDTGGRASLLSAAACSGRCTKPLKRPTWLFAPISAFLQLAARQEDPDTLFFNRTLSIEGDTELGLIVKNMLDAMEWPKFAGMMAFRH